MQTLAIGGSIGSPTDMTPRYEPVIWLKWHSNTVTNYFMGTTSIIKRSWKTIAISKFLKVYISYRGATRRVMWPDPLTWLVVCQTVGAGPMLWPGVEFTIFIIVTLSQIVVWGTLSTERWHWVLLEKASEMAMLFTFYHASHWNCYLQDAI